MTKSEEFEKRRKMYGNESRKSQIFELNRRNELLLERMNNTDINGIYNKLRSGEWEDSKTYEKYIKQIEQYRDDYSTVSRFSDKSEKEKNDFLASLDSLSTVAKNQQKAFSQFKSKKDYDDAIKYRKMATEAASQKRANTLQNIAAEVARDKTPDLPIKGKSVKSISELLNEKSNDVLETFTDKAKSNISSNNYNRTYLPRESLSTLIDKSRKQGQLESMKNSGSIWADSSKTEDLERSYWDTYTDEDNYNSTPILKKYEEYKVLGEKPAKILSYLDENGLTEELKKYKSFIEYEKDKTENELYYKGKVKKFATDTPAAIGESILSVPANLVGGTIAEASNIAQAAFNGSGLGNGRINVYDNWHDLANYAINVRGAVTENIDSDIGRFAYQTGMSMADSAVVGLIAKGIGNVGIAAGMSESQALAMAAKIATIPLASSAANQTTRSMLEEGYTPTQAFRMGVASGFAEYITEAYSVESLLKNINGVSAAAIATNIRNQALAEGTEEVNSNILNRVFEAGILGSESHNNHLFMYYKEQGLSDKDAYIKVLQNNLYDDFTAFAGGAISGGLMSAGGSIMNSSSLLNYIGKIAINNGTDGAIINLALSMPTDTVAYKYASKFGSEVTPNQVGKTALLIDEYVKELKSNEVYNAVYNRAIELGATKAQAKAIANYKAGVETQQFTSVEELIKSLNTTVSSKSGAVIMDEYRGTGESARKWVSQLNNNLNDINVLEERLNNSLNRSNNAKSVDEHISEMFDEPTHNNNIATVLNDKQNLKVSETGNTVNATTKEEISIAGVESLKNGKMILKLDDGSTIDSKDVAFSNETEATVYDYISNMDINAETADRFIKAYTDDIKPAEYKMGMSAGYTYGKVGYPMSAIRNIDFLNLHSDQQNTAYTMGVVFGDNQAQAQQEAVDKRVDSGKKKGIKRKGKVVFEGSAKNAKLNDIQKKSVSVIGWIVSRTTHNTVHFYRSEVNADGNRVFADNVGRYKKGEDVAPNGFFDTKTGDIWIDINAGDNGEGVILWTAAHEFTHLIKQNSPAMFKRLSDFLMQEYGAKGVDINKLIDKKLKSVEKNHPELSESEQRDLAHEEVVADSMQRMLTDTDVLSKIEKLKTKDHQLWQRLKDFLTNLQAKIKELYGELPSQSREAAIVKQMGDAVDTLADMFAEALVDAGNVQESADIAESNSDIVRLSERNNIDFNPENKTLQEQLTEAYVASKSFDRRYVYIGNFTKGFRDILSKKGIAINDYPIVMNYRDAYLSMHNKETGKYKGTGINYHNLGVQGLKEALLSLSNPQSVLKSKKEGKIELILQSVDKKGNPLLSVVEINTSTKNDKKFLDVHVVTSVYGKRSIDNYIKTASLEGRLIDIEKEVASQGISQVQYEGDINDTTSTNSIRQDTENSQEKSSEKSEHKYSFGGRNSKTSNTSLLAKAEQMESEGAESEEIRQETGWFRGYDGGWRYEINDLESSLIENPKIHLHDDGQGPYFSGKLTDILNHQDLFKAYPQLKKIKVRICTLDYNASGAYMTDTNDILLNFELFNRNTKEYQDYYDKNFKDEIEEIEQTPEYKEYSRIVEDEELNLTNYEEWLKLTQSAVKRFFSSEIGKRYYELTCLDDGFEGERIELGWSKAARSTLMHELQHAIQVIEGFEDGANGDDKNYYNNAGEVESRDVQARLDYTSEQRKNIRPDIDRKNVVLTKGIRFSERNYSYEDYDKPITIKDIETLRSIGKKSINNFTSEDIEKSQKWAYKFYKELGTKSPFFRAWFGDWRANDFDPKKNIPIKNKVSFNGTSDAVSYIKTGLKSKTLFRGDIKNTDTDFTINIGAQVYNDTLTYANRALSRANDFIQYNDRLNILFDIKQLCEDAVLFDTEITRDDSIPDRAFVHKFYALTSINKRSYLVKIIVDEINSQHGDIRRAYNLNGIKITPTVVSQVYKPAGTMSAIGSITSISSISDLYALVKKCDKEFKPGKPVNPALLNEDGTPKEFYHGTDTKFTVFDRTKGRSTMDIQGMFFSPWELDAPGYGKNVCKYYLSIQNPAPEGVAYKALNKYKGQNYAGVKARDFLISLGYDGVNNSDEEIIAFYPEQIKSATDNIGTFDSDNSDIRFSERDTGYAKELEEVNAQITKENKKLKEDVSDLKELLKLQTQETHGKIMKKSSVDAVAKKIMRENNASGNVSEFSNLIKDVYSYIINGEDVNYETIKEKAKPAVQWLENNQKITKGALSPEAQEIFNHLKGTRVYISPEIKDEIEYIGGKGGYNSLRKNLTGWVTLTSNPNDLSLDSLWGELSELFPGYFKADTNSQDQLGKLSSVINALRETRYNTDDIESFDYEAEAKQWRFEKIYDGFWDVATLHTVADKYAKQINLLKSKHKTSMEKMRESRKKAISAIKEKYRDSIENARERRNITLYRTKIKGLHSRMDRMLRHPTDNSYVPKEFFSLILDTLSTVDIRTGNINKTQEALSAVYDEYQKIKDSVDSEYSAVYDEDLADEIFALKEHLKGGNIYGKDLTSIELQAIYETLQSIYGTVLDAKKLIGENEKMTIRESGNKIIDEQEEIAEKYKDNNKYKAFIKMLDDKSSLFYLNSIRAILKMSNFNENSELVRLTEALNEGLKKKYGFKMMINKKSDALVKTKEGQKAFDSAVSDIIDFGWAKMTKMQAAQLMLTLERESKIGTKHISTGGATITDARYHDNVEKRRDNAKLIKHDTLQMMSDIQEKLSGDEWMQKYIEVAKEIMRVDSKRVLNETSQIIKHRDIAADSYYIPFITDNSFTVREIEGLVHNATIEGRGAFKSTTKGAGNALYIEGLDIVLDRCIDTAADYYGLAVPIRNINRALNVKNDESGRSVKDSIKKNWKSDGLKLIEQTISDLQTGRKNDSIAILDTLKSAFITSTLNGNISVAIKQAASLDTAFAVLDFRPSAVAWKEFAKTVANYDSIISEIDEHTSEHWRRRIGLSLDEIATMKQNSGFFGKVSRKLPTAINGTKWIQMIDCWTTATFWNMAKQDIEKAVKNGKYQFEIGSDEYWKAVTNLYEETVETTQPMYDTLHRSEMQKNAVSNKIFMFKTQPLQNAGMLYEAAHGLAAVRASGDAELAKERANKLGKVIYSQTRSAITFALMNMIAAAIKGKMKRYKDDDDELTFASVTERIVRDMGGTGTGLLLPIGGSEIYNYLESVISGNGYAKALLSYPTVDWINNYVSSLTNVFKSPSVQSVTQLIMKFGDITGQPVTNYYNLIHGIGYNIKDIVNGDFLEFEASEEDSTSHMLKRAHGAYEKGNNTEVKQYIQEIVNSKVAEVKTEKEAKSAIRSSLTSKYKPLLLEAYKNKDDKAMAEIRMFLNATGIYGTASEVVSTTQDWIRKSKK